MNKKRILLIVALSLIALVIAIVIYARFQISNTDNQNGSTNELNEGDGTVTFKQIKMNEAKEIFESDVDGNYIILDVRRADEFAEGHIPGAINVANESIGSETPKELPDKDQVIYVYCRSGNRSRQAAEKLVMLGYTNIIEFGGIMDWTGELEK